MSSAQPLSVYWDRIVASYLADEDDCLRLMLAELRSFENNPAAIEAVARGWIERLRAGTASVSPLDALLLEYQLSNEEGVLLMCLAESLLRIPDAATVDVLIDDILARGDWDSHMAQSASSLVNLATRGLGLAQQVFSHAGQKRVWGRLTSRVSKPLVGAAIRAAMGLLGRHFVLGETIAAALKHSAPDVHTRYSYDMLGEAALTHADAEAFYQAYSEAIRVVSSTSPADQPWYGKAGISVKLSALHPRYDVSQQATLLDELAPKLLALCEQAKQGGIGLTLDAEESDRLLLSLALFERVYRSSALTGWEGFGLALQAYQKRAASVVDWLAQLARQVGRRIPVRLVKGAYWDGEIKRAQQLGLPGYPVFTRKAATDVSYLVCAARMRAQLDALYPQFATHNAHTIAWVRAAFSGVNAMEFQRLHGMGEALYRYVQDGSRPCPVRVYAPVGTHDQLLPYLVRRLLENGVNSSFVNRLRDMSVAPEQLVRDPIAQLTQAHAAVVPLPSAIFGAERINSPGYNLADPLVAGSLQRDIKQALSRRLSAHPLVSGDQAGAQIRPIADVYHVDRRVGDVVEAGAGHARIALDAGAQAFEVWSARPVDERAAIIERTADLLVRDAARLIGLLVHEAGKTLPDAIAEWREAIDFCRYYAAQARSCLSNEQQLPGPTGETNRLRWRGRGVFVCISPWNFPLAIFVGQITAALVTGNTVIAKPAAQTPLVAYLAVGLLHEAGVPKAALQFLPGPSAVLGPALLNDARVAGVAFTGSTAAATAINRSLAGRRGPLACVIAETGGINAMLVDSSALPEQVVRDVVRSAFNSAGQRCSALRLLLVQDDIAQRLLPLLQGAMATLRLGDPANLATDVGPVIDQAAKQKLEAYVRDRIADGVVCWRWPGELPVVAPFVAPTVLEIERVADLGEEIFGPILHVVRYRLDRLEQVIDDVNALGYGLTFGIHSRIRSRIDVVTAAIRAGNVYINRDMIGAVVGSQPFGGEALSGTGFKAGGPHYLYRFSTEQVIADNVTAIGGNAALMSGQDDAASNQKNGA